MNLEQISSDNTSLEINYVDLKFAEALSEPKWLLVQMERQMGEGFVVLQEYTDGSMRGNIYIDDGTNPGKLMGEFIGFRK